MIDNGQRQDITAILADVVNAVVGHLDMNALLDQIINTTMETLHAEVCSIFLEDKENEPGIIKCVAGSGFAKKIVGKAKYRSGEGLTGSVFQYGESYNSKTREEHENLKIRGKKIWEGKFDHEQWPSGGNEFRNGIGLPLRIKDQILGVIKVENKIQQYGDYFTEDDEMIFRTIANVVALTIENARLHRKAEEQAKSILTALAGVVNAVVGHLDMNVLLDQIINTTMETLHAEVSSIFLEDKESEPGIIKCVAGSGFAKKIVGIAEYKLGEGFTGFVAQYGGEFNIKSRAQLENLNISGRLVWQGKWDDKQWSSGESEFRNLIALPLKIGDRTLGVIKVENKIRQYGDAFTDEDVTIFKTIANVIALTIEKTKLQLQTEDQLKEISLMASHRINNQVTRYDGVLNKLGRFLKSGNPSLKSLAEIKDDLDVATSNLKTMINDFNNYGKPIRLEKSLVDINEIINNEKWLVKPTPPIEITFDPDPRIPLLEVDPGRFSESIKELLNNSRRILENAGGYGRIHISSKLIGDEKTAKSVLIRIEDNGPGFSKDFRIFVPFNSTDPKRTGLGLATVKQTIEAHGGTISLLDQDKPGACFEIVLNISGGTA